MKHRLCNECYAATGHAEWCVSKGYAGVGPHPDAPPDTARAPVRTTPPAQCPCGIARADCEYHAVAAAPSYEVYDIVDVQISFDGIVLRGTITL